MKEDLFSGRPNEVLAAVNASDVAIFKLAFALDLGTPDFFVRYYLNLFHHGLLPGVRSLKKVLRYVALYKRPLVSNCEEPGADLPRVANFSGQKYNYVETVSRLIGHPSHLSFW
jgi:hypothetical protein